MDVRYLEYILEIAAQRSITKAKDRLYVSQSTLSQYLIRLETEIGTPLFYRKKNELVPTPAGELYLEAARNVVEIRRNLYAQIDALEETGTLRVGVSSSWGLSVMAQVVPLFHARHPGIVLDIRQERFQTIRQALQDGRLDLALSAVSGEVPLQQEKLRTEEIALAVSATHPAAGEGTLTGARFRALFGGTPLLQSQPGSTILQLSEDWLRQCGATPPVACVINNNQAALDMVAAGLGMAFVPRSYAEQAEDVAVLSLSPKLERENLLLLRPNLAVGAVEEYLMELIRNHSLFQ